MPEQKMTVAKVSEKEIDALNNVLQEIQWFIKASFDFDALTEEDFPILHQVYFHCKGKDNEFNEEHFFDFFKAVFRHISATSFEKVIFNLSTLIDNCADPDSSTLEFNPKISRAFDLMNYFSFENYKEGDGNQELQLWFELSYASFLTMPRTLMEAMPDEWQMKMAKLLTEYNETFDTSSICEGTRVQAYGSNGKFTKFPSDLLNYRRPNKEFIESLKIKVDA